MIVEQYEPEGIDEQINITVSSDKKEIYATPWKWFTAEVYNAGPDQIKVMTNSNSLPNAITLDPQETRTFGNEKKPTLWRLEIYAESGKTGTAQIVTSR